MDLVVQTSKYFSIGVWIAEAVSLATNEEEVKNYKYNAVN